MMTSNNIQENSKPLVSICCFTYNQEKYIQQTLESLLMQRTSFPIEIIVHDDASNDSTKKIIEEYAFNFTQIIKPIFQHENRYSLYGINYIFKYVTSNATGKYIAVCAGDDFWIDPLKIQKQVDFLESNPDYGLVHTRAAGFNEAKQAFNGSHGFKVLNIEEFLIENTIAAVTVCLRRSLLKEYFEQIRPEKHIKWPAEDFPAWAWFIQRSKIKFIDDYTAVYRSHMGSISQIKDDFKRLNFEEGIYSIVDFYLAGNKNFKNQSKIRARYYSNMIKLYFLNRRWDGIRKSIKVFYNARDWLNILWIAITLPFYYSKFIVKGSYRVRSTVFDLFNIYPTRN